MRGRPRPWCRCQHVCNCKTVQQRAAGLRALAKECRKMAKKEPGEPSHPINYFGQTTWALAAIAADAKACEVELGTL